MITFQRGEVMDSTERINSKAIISLVLGAITIVLPIIGIVTGIIGIIYYNKAKHEMIDSGESGEGVSIGGLILNIVGLVFQLLMIIGIIFIVLAIFVDVMAY